MAKKTKPAPPTREGELTRVEALLERLDGYAVPELQADKSLEECRQLNDQFEHVNVEAIAIASPQHYTDYGSLLRKIKVVQKRLEEQRVEQKEPSLKEGRTVDAKFKGFQGFAVRLHHLFADSMKKWEKEQERLRYAEEVRLRELARKEQEKIDRAAEKKAKALEAKNKQDEADAVRDAKPIIGLPVVAQTNIPKVAGVSSTKRWGVEVTDKDIENQRALLLNAIAEWNASHEDGLPGPPNQLIPVEYWDLNIQKLGAMARALKGELKLPNVKVIDNDSKSVRV